MHRPFRYTEAVASVLCGPWHFVLWGHGFAVVDKSGEDMAPVGSKEEGQPSEEALPLSESEINLIVAIRQLGYGAITRIEVVDGIPTRVHYAGSVKLQDTEVARRDIAGARQLLVGQEG